jgi:hypothetical protein
MASPNITETLLETVHDTFQRRYAPMDAEGLEMCLQRAIADAKTAPLVLRGIEHSIAQVGFEHLSIMLRTPEPGSDWPLCSNAPGCVAEGLFRSSFDSDIRALSAELPDCRLRAFVTESELQTYAQTGQLPLDLFTRKCVACLLNWQNSMVAVAHVASSIDGSGQAFDQRVSMYAGPEENGVHPDWLMHPGISPLDKLSGFVAPMPYWAAWSVVPTIIEGHNGFSSGLWLDPQPMRHPLSDKVSAIKHCSPLPAECVSQHALPDHAADVMALRWPRHWPTLCKWLENDPTLLLELPMPSMYRSISRFSQLPYTFAVLMISVVVLERTKARLACVTSTKARDWRRLVHQRQAALMRMLRFQAWTTIPGLPSSLAVALAAPPTLCEAVYWHLRLWPTDLLRPNKDLPGPRGIVQQIMLGYRSKAATALKRTHLKLPLDVTAAILGDHVNGLPFCFNLGLYRRFSGDEALLEAPLTLEQRLYVWVAVAAYIAGCVWGLPLRKPWALYFHDARWALKDPSYTCRNRITKNTPLLAALPARSRITELRRLAAESQGVQWPVPVDRDNVGAVDLVRWVSDRRQIDATVPRPSLQTQYTLPLPKVYWIHPDLLHRQLLSHAECVSRLKPMLYCVCCATITQDQSRELDVDKRCKNPVVSNYSDTPLETCRWCTRDYGRALTMIQIQLAGHAVEVGGVLWTLCSVCCQQVMARNCCYKAGWQIVCMKCETLDPELAP